MQSLPESRSTNLRDENIGEENSITFAIAVRLLRNFKGGTHDRFSPRQKQSFRRILHNSPFRHVNLFGPRSDRQGGRTNQRAQRDPRISRDKFEHD